MSPGFAFSSAGEAVYLFSGGAATNLTGYSHGFSFGAAAPGATFGRYLLSTGEEDFTAQAAPSLGAANQGPRVGPVVMNEIHYHPVSEDIEFVELKNIAATNVALYDPERPANTWQLSGLGLAFPTNLVLAPGQLLLLAATNPASFRARYSVPAEALILGPWSGVLQDSGERLELQRPGLPDTNGAVPNITVDAVRYNNKAPWPTAAAGGGPSLQRRSDGAYGNDPASWAAVLATPGRSFSGGAAPVITKQPASVAAIVAGEATFQAAAAGAAPLFYQWRFNGVPLDGAAGPTLTLANLQPDQAGGYSVIVFNEAGSTESEPAMLNVIVPAVILAQPGDVYVRVRPDPQAAPATNATFSVVASAASPLRYQWRFNGLELSGATNTSLTISNVQPADGGAYDVKITSAEGAVLSAAARLYPLVTPVILRQPLSQAVVAGGTVTLSVAFTGSPAPFSNEWRRSSTPVATHVLNLNESVDFLTFTVPNAPTTVQYRAWIRNLATSASGISSATATITVLADANANGLPDVWESAYGINDPNADSDGDGMRNWQEYQAGTNPTNALSCLKVEIGAIPGWAALSFGAASNLTYTLQYQDRLGGGVWANFADVVARSSNRVETLTDTNWAPGRFYRVVTPRQP